MKKIFQKIFHTCLNFYNFREQSVSSLSHPLHDVEKTFFKEREKTEYRTVKVEASHFTTRLSSRSISLRSYISRNYRQFFTVIGTAVLHCTCTYGSLNFYLLGFNRVTNVVRYLTSESRRSTEAKRFFGKS